MMWGGDGSVEKESAYCTVCAGCCCDAVNNALAVNSFFRVVTTQHTVADSYDYSILYIVLLCINFMIEKQIFLPGPDEKSSESFKDRVFIFSCLSFAFCFCSSN